MPSADYDDAYVGSSGGTGKGLKLKGSSSEAKKCAPRCCSPAELWSWRSLTRTRRYRKKKKSKSSASSEPQKALQAIDDAPSPGSRDASPSTHPPPPSSSRPSTKTAAELRFEAVQRQRMAERASKSAVRTHKDRVQEFNDKLERLSEHYDIPKVRSTMPVCPPSNEADDMTRSDRVDRCCPALGAVRLQSNLYPYASTSGRGPWLAFAAGVTSSRDLPCLATACLGVLPTCVSPVVLGVVLVGGRRRGSLQHRPDRVDKPFPPLFLDDRPDWIEASFEQAPGPFFLFFSFPFFSFHSQVVLYSPGPASWSVIGRASSSSRVRSSSNVGIRL